jgi:flagellar protein FlbT
MPLKIDLKPGEKFVINGAVLSVGRDGRSLLLQNEAVLLREKDIMQEEDANTPAKRIYFVIMLMYIDPANSQDYTEKYRRLAIDFVRAAPMTDVTDLLSAIDKDVASGNFYQALRSCRKLFDIEDAIFKAGRSNAV